MATYEVRFTYRAQLIAAASVEASSKREAAALVRGEGIASEDVDIFWTETKKLWPRHVQHVMEID